MGNKERYWAPTSFKRRGVVVETKAKEEEEAAQTSSGCMCAFFHFFDFHPFHFSIQQHQHQQPPPLKYSSSCLPQDLTVPKGAEAPRNSLEILEGGDATTANTIMPCFSKEENLKIPIKSIQFIKTSGSNRSGKIGNVNDLSPGTKTPTLVARLMGLDLLPDAQSPSSSSSSTTSSSSYSSFSRQNINKTKSRHSTREYNEINNMSRSLPETPRISSARRSDVEHHRLSLQIIKENIIELELPPRLSFSKTKLEEQSSSRNTSSQYARQIVKQVKESVSRRKLGTDITNTITNHDDQELVLPSCSPRLRFIDHKNIKPTTTTTKDQNSQLSKKALSTKPKPNNKQEVVQQLPKCKKAANERFSTPKLKNKQEASFVVKPKSKRSHPLVSKTVLNLNLLPQKQSQQVCESEEPKYCSSQLSSGSRQRYKCRHEDKSNGDAGSIATTRADDGLEFQYVKDTLSRTGLLVKDTESFKFPHLDPSIFHHLEKHYHTTTTGNKNPLGLRCNRRLLFDLVDEILLEILGPFVEEYGGSQLAEKVWERIGRFPSAKNCEVLEDIDALIEMEEVMGGKRRKKKVVMMMVAEIEGNIVGTLVHETVMELEWWVRTGRTASFERVLT